MENVKEALYMSMKNEVDALKQRNIALIYAVQGMERERIEMYNALFDGNLCCNCAQHEACKENKDEKSSFRAKVKNPETFCAKWEYSGKYTPVNEIVLMAISARGGRGEDG